MQNNLKQTQLQHSCSIEQDVLCTILMSVYFVAYHMENKPIIIILTHRSRPFQQDDFTELCVILPPLSPHGLVAQNQKQDW